MPCEQASEWPRHGGQAGALLERFGLPADHPFEDFSANLNPLGPPGWVPAWLARHVGELARYPDVNYAEPRAAIAAHHGVMPGQVLLANGGGEAIFLAAGLCAGGRAGVLAPTFNEYARALAGVGAEVREISLADSLEDLDAVFLCRPNNPDGGLLALADVDALLARAAACGCRVVVDEAFIDMTARPADAAALPTRLAAHPNLILLRSMTKFYTLPGLRLGYALASEALIAAMARRQPPWSVNRLAAGLVAPLLADTAFSERTRAWLAAERPRMHRALQALGLEVAPGETCFFLLCPGVELRRRGITAEALLERLLCGGILVRHTHGYKGLDGRWLRLALRDADANDRLLKGLGDALKGEEDRRGRLR
ncbi:MAG: threonine-phosphate decarboxylase CobD [Halomonas sp.]|nr:threonine-phosphate decarboxylase CobD [Halomonas sp.]MDN6296488.1 threonine-phosphate decarboxylase CobD [Halomonas sp.]MDN6313841.1 threonine-phosphate decarboxylase CobD [Halomonas sp.]MDN6335295.1 threonine-phosphate decarboxylase CobD [Halomonas sp.]